MTNDKPYDRYEVCSSDGATQIATANNVRSIRLAARTQIEEGALVVVYGPTSGDPHPTWLGRAHRDGNRVLLHEYRNGVWQEVGLDS
jgi:hypothetical protein